MSTSDILEKGPTLAIGRKPMPGFPDSVILSVRSSVAGVIGCAGWLPGEKPVKLGRHKLLSAEAREQWLSQFDIA